MFCKPVVIVLWLNGILNGILISIKNLRVWLQASNFGKSLPSNYRCPWKKQNKNKLKQHNWRGVWNKVLSDTWCNVKFSFFFSSKYKASWKENLVVNQTSLRAFFHAPLQLFSAIVWGFMISSMLRDSCFFWIPVVYFLLPILHILLKDICGDLQDALTKICAGFILEISQWRPSEHPSVI